MGDDLFEVAFSGQISDGAKLQEVRTRVGKIFNADGAKLDQLFSGQRIVIKKNVDQLTAQKYQKAFKSAGALVEVKSMAATGGDPAAPASPTPAPQAPAAQGPAPTPANESSSAVATPPQTAPLGITGDQITELSATLAPVGSELQSEIKKVPEPQFDLSAFDLAPVGSTLGDEKKAAPPPPPDTTGLSMSEQ